MAARPVAFSKSPLKRLWRDPHPAKPLDPMWKPTLGFSHGNLNARAMATHKAGTASKERTKRRRTGELHSAPSNLSSLIA
jgi:hypothetical protein